MEDDGAIVLEPLNSNKGNDNPDSLNRLLASNTLSNESVITVDRPVSNFFAETDPKNNSGPSVIGWDNVLKNAYYILAWYFFSTVLSFYNKNLMGKKHFNLNLPIFVSAMHSGMQFLITMVLMKGYCCIYKRTESKPVSIYPYFTRVVPCAMASALEISMANASFVFITLSFYTMVKSSTPIWVLLFAFAFGLEHPRVILVFIITVISVGVILTVEGEPEFDLTGFLLVLGAAIVSGLRWSLTQILLQNEEGMNHPIATLYYVSPVMCIMMTILSLIFEHPFNEFITSDHFKDFDTGFRTFLLMFIGGILAFCMTIAEFFLIQNTSTVTLSVAGISKEIVVISLSVLIYQDKITPVNLLGLIISISGIAGYNYYKIRKYSSDDKKGLYHVLPHHKNESLD